MNFVPTYTTVENAEEKKGECRDIGAKGSNASLRTIGEFTAGT